MTPYQHGGDITAFARLCGCETSEVIDLSSNINFVKPQTALNLNDIEITPYPDYTALYEMIASHYGVDTTEIELFNGGSAAIFSLFRYLRTSLSHCTIYSPAYLEYKRAAELFGYQLHLIDRFKYLDREVKAQSLVIFVNPSTPDGYGYDMEALLSKWIERSCTILVDESFLEFTKMPSMSNHIKNYDKLYILKSMTKFQGAAGIRMGTLISNNINIEKLHRFEPAWKLSALDAAYIKAVLNDHTLPTRTHAIINENRQMLIRILEEASCVEHIFPGCANYLLVKLGTIDAHQLQKRLTPHRILIRNCENFDGLDSRYVRIAIKTKESIRALKEALHA
jgi:threonine-phosphate decarboxylase